jgi:hypothetical protein
MAWLQTLSGKAFDLSNPDPAMVDFEADVAPALAKLARFTGHTLGDMAYSVAQHCVLGAESILAATGSERLAALFLLHDAHEAYIGDIPTPAVEALGEMFQDGIGPEVALLKWQIDHAIFEAAGVPMPTEAEAAIIKRHDTAMMNAERAVLKLPPPRSWGAEIDAVPAADVDLGDLEPWEPWAAEERWMWAFERFVGVES